MSDIRRYVKSKDTTGHGSGGGGGKNTYVYNITNVTETIDRENAEFVKISANEANFDQITSKNIDTSTINAATVTSGEGIISDLKGSTIQYDGATFSNIACSNITGDGLTFNKAELTEAIINELKSRNITTEYLTVTKSAHFFELIIDKIKSVGGQIILSAANAIIDYVEAYNSNNQQVEITDNNIAYFKVYWKATDESGHDISNDWLVNDQAICQNFCDVNDTTGTKGNKYYWRLVKSTDSGNKVWIDLESGLKSDVEKTGYTLELDGMIYENAYYGSQISEYNDEWIITPEANNIWTTQSSYDEMMMIGDLTVNNSLDGLSIIPYFTTDPDDPNYTRYNGMQPALTGSSDDPTVYMYSQLYVFLRTPANIYLEAQYDDGTCEYYISQVMTIEHIIPVNPLKNIVNIIIRPIEQRKWTKCNWITLSNLTNEKDADLTGYDAIPERDDNIVQLGYRWNLLPSPTDDDKARASAIIIAAYKTPDSEVTPPSYAQYRLINNFTLSPFRQTYFDATTARFVGTFVTDTGAVINDELFESYRIIPDKTILTQNDTLIGCSLLKSFNSTEIITVVPSGYKITITARNDNGGTLRNRTISGGGDLTSEYNMLHLNGLTYSYVDIMLYKENENIDEVIDKTVIEFVDTDVDLTGYATQQYVDNAVNSIVVPDKYQYKLLPKKEDVIVKLTGQGDYEDIVSALYANLEYDLIKTDGTTIDYVDYSSMNFYMQIECEAPTWSTSFTQSSHTATFSNQNLLNVINPSNIYPDAKYRDYRKIPDSTRQPEEFHIKLYDRLPSQSGAKIVDERILEVTFKADSIFKVTEAGMTSAVVDATGEAESLIQQAADDIILQVNNTGIDIVNHTITLTADNLIAKNENNEKTMWIDSDGNMTVRGTVNNLISVVDISHGINMDKLISWDAGIDPETGTGIEWDYYGFIMGDADVLDVLRLGDVIKIKSTNNRNIVLPFYLYNEVVWGGAERGCYLRTTTKYGGNLHLITTDEMMQLVGRRINIMIEPNNSSKYLLLPGIANVHQDTDDRYTMKAVGYEPIKGVYSSGSYVPDPIGWQTGTTNFITLECRLGPCYVDRDLIGGGTETAISIAIYWAPVGYSGSIFNWN